MRRSFPLFAAAPKKRKQAEWCQHPPPPRAQDAFAFGSSSCANSPVGPGGPARNGAGVELAVEGASRRPAVASSSGRRYLERCQVHTSTGVARRRTPLGTGAAAHGSAIRREDPLVARGPSLSAASSSSGACTGASPATAAAGACQPPPPPRAEDDFDIRSGRFVRVRLSRPEAGNR
jgi:hypothetical protein